MKCQNKKCGRRVRGPLNQLNNPKRESDYGKLVCDKCYKKMQKKEVKE